jgi:hypothetical protein
MMAMMGRAAAKVNEEGGGGGGVDSCDTAS